MEKKIEKIIQTRRYQVTDQDGNSRKETWLEVLDRVNRESGVDVKITYRLVGIILDKFQSLENKVEELVTDKEDDRKGVVADITNLEDALSEAKDELEELKEEKTSLKRRMTKLEKIVDATT